MHTDKGLTPVETSHEDPTQFYDQVFVERLHQKLHELQRMRRQEQRSATNRPAAKPGDGRRDKCSACTGIQVGEAVSSAVTREAAVTKEAAEVSDDNNSNYCTRYKQRQEWHRSEVDGSSARRDVEGEQPAPRDKTKMTQHREPLQTGAEADGRACLFLS